MGRTLHLPLKGVYFDQIAAGTKTEEYRLVTPFWIKRLEGREYRLIVLTKGYPAREDRDRRMVRLWRGLERKTITHPHFGPDPVEVFAIKVNPEPADGGLLTRHEGFAEVMASDQPQPPQEGSPQ